MATKKDVVKQIQATLKAQEVTMSQVEISKVLSALPEVILHVLKEGDTFNYQGLVTFGTQMHKAKTARNPKDGTPVEVPERIGMKLTKSKKFLELLRDEA